MRSIPKILVLVVLVSLIVTGLLILLSISDHHIPNAVVRRHISRLQQTEIADDPQYTDGDSTDIEEGYVVHTSQCHIPDMELWHPSILSYVQKDTVSLSCNKSLSKPALTYTRNSILAVNMTNLPYYGILDFCEYVEIIRPEKDDSKIGLGDKRYTFKEEIVVKKEFIKVYCYSTNNSLMYHNLHAFTPTKQLLRHIKDSLYLRHKRRGYLEHLNVLMVGIDSVSRVNFHRQFPKTASILKDRLRAYEMYGYNKVRDNTFINLTPMFLGKYVEETDWNEMNNEAFDKYQFAWKRFAAVGYHTMFAEDAPSIAIWNFEKAGFLNPPADYYLRPFSLAMAGATKMWNSHNHCFGDRLETDMTLDYVENFIKSRQGAAHFAFTFLTRPTYDSVNQNTDSSHAHFLERLIQQGLLENTMVIYFSDHGARRGPILSTYIGKLEERLPAMFVSLPEWLTRKYPQISKNLEINQHRLTTPFDVNALLDDVLRFSGVPKEATDDMRSISLFNRVPATRSCGDATVDDHWCTCLQQKPVSVDNMNVLKAAQAILARINSETMPYSGKCVRYKLDKVTDALLSTPFDKLMTFKLSVNDVIGRKEYYGKEAVGRLIMYHVTIKVHPSGGVYQGTVKYDTRSDSYNTSGYISRTSPYGTTSWCINDHKVKKYCYCKEQRD